jgi:hypothetical protein
VPIFGASLKYFFVSQKKNSLKKRIKNMEFAIEYSFLIKTSPPEKSAGHPHRAMLFFKESN